MQKIKDLFDKNNFKYTFGVLTAAALAGGFIYYRQQLELHETPKHTSFPKKQSGLLDLLQDRYLTQELAVLRFAQIRQDSVRYHVDLLLMKGNKRGQFFKKKLYLGPNYEGVVQSTFTVNHNEHDLFFDFRGKEIRQLVVNGENITSKLVWSNLFIRIPKTLLKVNEENQVIIHFFNAYTSDGQGLHSYTDSDGKQYLYSQCESYFCNRLHIYHSFPCMDQPDLKSKLKFSVVAPQEWEVISNENYTHNQQFNFEHYQEIQKHLSQQLMQTVFSQLNPSEYKFWLFDQTQPLPTYLFCIVAGEYWSTVCTNPVRNVGMKLYCRESLKEHMEKMKDFIFEVTKESMLFYEKFFGVEYQFSKYDSVFVAEYNWGAMENPGCVTFNDLYVFKEQKPKTTYSQLANTIAHEMAHHWFGNFVTMKWWNDLWLNESYADFISHFCLEHLDIKTIPLSNIPVMFNLRKGQGYREDQMITTHPIAGDVSNTEVAETIFDGITYSKGASTMKQLLCIMGAKNFGDACGSYFKKFGWRNATLNDLLNSLQEKFQQENPQYSLHEWNQEWIQTAGLNEIEAQWNQNDNSQEASIIVHQRSALPQFPTLRRHKIKIAYFRDDASVVVEDALIQNTEETKLTYDGSQNYKAVLLNYGDQSFVKVLLDGQSLQFFRNNLHKIDDLLTKTLIFRALFDTVRDGKISSEEYVDILLAVLPNENSDEILNTQLQFLQGAVSSMTPRKYGNSQKQFQKLVSRKCCQRECLNLLSSNLEDSSNRTTRI